MSKSTSRNPANVSLDQKFYWVLWVSGVIIIAGILFVAWMMWNVQLFNKFDIIFDGGSTMILIATVYLAFSLKGVRADEVAGAFCYGKALVRLVSGLHFVPFGLMQIAKASRTVQEFQCPGEPEKVFKGDDSEVLPLGMVRPIRAVTRAPSGKEKDILDARMTLVVNFVIQYAVIDIFDYIANFGSKEYIEGQMRDIGEVTIVEDVTQNTPSSFIKNLPEINKKLAKEIKDRFKNSGVKIISVRLISPDISHKVSTALANIPIARAEARQMEFRAEGQKTKTTKEGEGTAAAELALLNAQAEGRKKMMGELDVKGEVIIAAEAVRGLSDKTAILVVGAEGGMRDIMGLVKGAQSALNTVKGV